MKILITPRSFGKEDPQIFDFLVDKGLELVRNETGGILTKAQLMDAISDCDGVIVGVDPLDRDVLNAAVKLKAISKYGVGVDNIDVQAAEARGIPVSRTAGANSEAVADYTMALMLAVARKVVMIDRSCRQRDWKKSMTRDISGGTLGLVGLGAIGKLVARRASGFGMQCIAYDPYWDEDYAKANKITRVSVDEVYRTADVITLHVPLTSQTRHMVGKRELALMRPDAILINTARGGLLDEDALLDALEKNAIYGAGIDAFAEEPPTNPRWYQLDNVVLGSHCAASTYGAAYSMGRMAAQNLLHDLGITS